MKLDCYQVDAFTQDVFLGNPAAVVILHDWPEDALLQAIAAENNLSETAFLVVEEQGIGLRWFTPKAEVALCGHATLAAAHVFFEHRGHQQDVLRFVTQSGLLEVRREASGYCMDFPAVAMEAVADPPDALLEGLSGQQALAVYLGTDLLAVLEDESLVCRVKPDFAALAALPGRGLIVTAPGDDCDFVSRCFYPRLGVNEDPVTGSAHCQAAPFWADRLGRSELTAVQRSERSGRLLCRVRGKRVELVGNAVTYLQGSIDVPVRPSRPRMIQPEIIKT